MLLVKIPRYIPGRFLCVPWVLFSMVPLNISMLCRVSVTTINREERGKIGDDDITGDHRG